MDIGKVSSMYTSDEKKTLYVAYINSITLVTSDSQHMHLCSLRCVDASSILIPIYQASPFNAETFPPNRSHPQHNQRRPFYDSA